MGICFCRECKKILPPHSKEIIICPNCGLAQGIEKGLVSKEVVKKEVQKGKGISEEENIYANYPHKCKKCGYEKAQIIDMGIKYSDEDNLIFLKCGKCGFSERIGRKVS
ncbi:MAG: hypothetical protein KKB62_01900 [Nanoarchaeota archaeon]|nr:hypothetical protein [Nanoarchaeota archaeon]